MTHTVPPEVRSAIRDAHALLGSGDARGAIETLTQANRADPNPAYERALVRLRHEGCASLPPPGSPSSEPIVAEPGDGQVVEVTAAELTTEAIRMGLARSGSLLVRGLIPEGRAAQLVNGIEATYAAFDAAAAGQDHDDTWYVPFPMPAVIAPTNAGDAVRLSPGAPPAANVGPTLHRKITRDGAGIWTVESPRMLFEFFEVVDEVGLGEVISSYLGERPFLSANKCTLRKVPAAEPTGGWHQDGAFLGRDIGSLNCWIALNHCGIDAPGIDVVPKRFDDIVTPGGSGAYFKWSLSDDDVREAAGDLQPVRPEFGPGDALLFDHRLVHRTGGSPEMLRERYAIESWWFAPSAFPPSQLPLVY